jgi:hypothetical protein
MVAFEWWRPPAGSGPAEFVARTLGALQALRTLTLQARTG